MYDPGSMTEGPAWYESVDLTRLDASNNNLEDLNWHRTDDDGGRKDESPTENIFGSLQSLDLHDNRLQDLPPLLCDCADLTVLNLSKNRLERSKHSALDIIKAIPSLRELRLAENGFTGLLPLISECPNLEILDVHGNAFTGIDEQSFHCKALRQLDISANKLTRLPHLDLPNLTSLDISSNQIDIEDLTLKINAPNLTTLEISHCRINKLPHLRSTFPNLKKVFASGNSIGTLNPDAVRGLETLDLRNNDLRALPAEISLMEELKQFLVSGNPMRAPKREILEGPSERLMEWLRGRLPAGSRGDDGLEECF
ncbi:MAG: hypothetical protein Q9183_006821 [Haloplaca sp. 2 TL-2023]